jgi:capsular exopolysaccharide synthesis family protein
MSKIEAALRIAKDAQSGSPEDRLRRLEKKRKFDQIRNRSTLPAVVRLEPFVRYDLDQSVLAKNRIINDDYLDDALTSYKMLRTRVLHKMNANEWQTLAITSPRDGAGKSLTAINLAITMASQSARDVYLLDLDLRNPNISRQLGLPGFELDLGEHLAGRTPISQVCCDVGVDHLLLLPSSQRQPNSSELIASQTLQNLLRTILATATNPIIVIDLPAILSADDALAISPWVDGFLMVVSESGTGREDLTRSLEMLRESNLVGVVLNKSSERK